MRTTPKSPELIRAQVATYAAEAIPDHSNNRHVLRNLGDIASSDALSVERTAEQTTIQRAADGSLQTHTEATQVTAARKDDYTNFLRSVGGARYESIQGREELLTAYEHFAPAIAQLQQELADPATRKQHPAYLGSGANSIVFSIIDGGEKYAVRVPHNTTHENVKADVIDGHLAGAVLGKGMPHMEQIVAASYETGVTVGEIMPGKEMGDLSVGEIRQVTDEQLDELINTLTAANQRGIEIDPKPSNVFYDTDKGYGIVDYHSSKVASKSSASQELGVILGWMTVPLGQAGISENFSEKTTPQEYAVEGQLCEVNVDVLERYRNQIENKVSNVEDRTKALAAVDAAINQLRTDIIHYADPAWVAETLAAREARIYRQNTLPSDTWDLV